MVNSTFKKLAACLALVAASLSLAAAPAFAEGSNTTDVVSEDGNINVTVPTKVPMYVDAAGEVMTASGEALKITNNNASSEVIISNVDVKADDPNIDLAVKSGADKSSLTDWFGYKSGNYTKPKLQTTLDAGASLFTSWSLGKLDAENNSKTLEVATTKAGATIATVTYTFKEPDPVDFAVYSADDHSLRFYRRTSLPNVGETFSGLTVTAVSDDVDNRKTSFGDFAGAAEKAVVVDEGIKPTVTAYWFDSMKQLKTADLRKLNISGVTDMRRMFSGCSKLTSLDLSNFDTSSVTDMSYMFSGCSKLTSLDLSNFVTSKVTSMYFMFNGCSGLTSLVLSNFDTSSVTDMSCMFSGCSGLTSLDLSNFVTSKVTSMECMFSYCSGLTSLAVSNFDTLNVLNMYRMFSNCSGLTSLDLSSFDTSKVTNMGQMFYGCSKLASLNLSRFDTRKAGANYQMFYYCGSGSYQQKIIIGSSWSFPDFPDAGVSMWYGEDGTPYTAIDPAVCTVYYKKNPVTQQSVSDDANARDSAQPATAQMVATVDISTPTVLDTQQGDVPSGTDDSESTDDTPSDPTPESPLDVIDSIAAMDAAESEALPQAA